MPSSIIISVDLVAPVGSVPAGPEPGELPVRAAPERSTQISSSVGVAPREDSTQMQPITSLAVSSGDVEIYRETCSL